MMFKWFKLHVGTHTIKKNWHWFKEKNAIYFFLSTAGGAEPQRPLWASRHWIPVLVLLFFFLKSISVTFPETRLCESKFMSSANGLTSGLNSMYFHQASVPHLSPLATCRYLWHLISLLVSSPHNLFNFISIYWNPICAVWRLCFILWTWQATVCAVIFFHRRNYSFSNSLHNLHMKSSIHVKSFCCHMTVSMHWKYEKQTGCSGFHSAEAGSYQWSVAF